MSLRRCPLIASCGNRWGLIPHCAPSSHQRQLRGVARSGPPGCPCWGGIQSLCRQLQRAPASRALVPWLNSFFVLLSRPQNVDFPHLLIAAEIFHPAGKKHYDGSYREMNLWILLLWTSPRRLYPVQEYQRIFSFVDNVCHVWAMKLDEPAGSNICMGLTIREKKHARGRALIQKAMCAANISDLDVYLPVMALLGNLVQKPKDPSAPTAQWYVFCPGVLLIWVCAGESGSAGCSLKQFWLSCWVHLSRRVFSH